MTDITAGKGLRQIPLGSGRDTMVRELGKADAEDRDNAEGMVCEHYYYKKADVTFTFTSPEKRLTMITTASPRYRLAGSIRCGMPQRKVLDTVRDLRWGKPRTETVREQGEVPALLYSWPQRGVDLWFEKGRLALLQVSPVADEEPGSQ